MAWEEGCGMKRTSVSLCLARRLGKIEALSRATCLQEDLNTIDV